jgi:ABC-type transport system substrate-binding protein
MNRRDRFAVVGIFLALAIVGAALVIQTPSPASVAANRTPGPPTAYREGVVGHPSSINPLTARTQVDSDIVALVFRGLAKAGPDGTVVPDLATWTISGDGRTYTFNIRDDAFWADGQPVTSADVVYTVGVIQDPKYTGPVGASWQGIKAVAAGPTAVTISLTLPIAGFLRQAELPILPAHLLRDTDVAGLADSSYSNWPVGDGPYRIAALDDAHAVLKRVAGSGETPLSAPTTLPSATPTPSPLVFATATPKPKKIQSPTPSAKPTPSTSPTPSPTPTPTPPPTPTPNPSPTPSLQPFPSGTLLAGVDEIDLVFYDSAVAAASDYEAGRLDAVGGLTPDLTAAALKTAGSRAIPYQWASLISVVVNERDTHPELRDVNLRSGLLAAIDRTDILNTVLLGRGSEAELPIPNWSPSYDAGAIDPTPYSFYDATSYLSTARWERTLTGWMAPGDTTDYTMELLTLDQTTNPVVFATASKVAAAWQAIGLSVQLDAVSASSYIARLDSGDYSAAIAVVNVGLDPDLEPLLLSSQIGSGGSNVSGVADASLDQLLIGVHKTVDPVARQAAVSALEKYVSTVLPILPLDFREYDLVVSNRVRGQVSNQIAYPQGRFWDVLDWRLASGR